MYAAHPTWLSSLQTLSLQLGSLGVHLLFTLVRKTSKRNTGHSSTAPLEQILQ